MPAQSSVRRAARLAPLVLLATVAAVAAAHDTWLLPSALRVPVGRRVTLALTSGMAFPVDDFAIRAERVRRADVRLGGATVALGTPRAAPRALLYAWTPRTAGVATLALELAPKALTLRGRLIDEYLAELDAPAGARREWNRTAPDSDRWREVYTKHAKSFVLVERGRGGAGRAPSSDSSWVLPAGLGLELVPDRDPTTIFSGDTLPLRVLLAGRPLAGFVVGVEREAAPLEERATKFVRSDDAGRVMVPLLAPGRWLLKGTSLRRVHESSVDWRSDFTTLTLAVRPRPE